MDIADLVAANPGQAGTAPDSPSGYEHRDGGVDMHPERRAPEAAPAPPVQQAQPQAPPAEKPVMQVGSRDDEPKFVPEVSVTPTQTTTPEATAAPETPTMVPLPVHVEMRQQWQEARDNLARAQAAIAERDAWLQKNVPRLQAYDAQWERIKGSEERAAQAEQAKALAEAKADYLNECLANGEKPNLAAWEAGKRQEIELRAALKAAAETPALMKAEFERRDRAWAEQSDAREREEAMRQHVTSFESDFATATKEVPVLAKSDAFKRLVFAEKTNNPSRSVQEITAQYVAVVRAEKLASEAGTLTKAEVHGQLPKTTLTPGGTPSASSGTKNWWENIPASMGIAERIALHRRHTLGR